jgi:hypothetical protein
MGTKVGRPAHTAAIVLAIVIAGIFVAILINRVDFPLGTHSDEGGKVDLVINDANTSYHPILMLQLVRAANVFAKVSNPQDVVELGRRCAVIAGGFALFAAFLLARTVLPIPTALAATVASAVVPLMTVHARYFKEDIFALPFLLLALVGLILLLKSPTPSRAVLLGVTIGLAAAAKYVAAIILPFALIVLLVKRQTYVTGLVAAAAIGSFVLIELPHFLTPQFPATLQFEVEHAAQGHDVQLPITLTAGLFHLRESLSTGLGLPLLLLGLMGLAAPWFAPPERRQALLIIASFAVLWYVIHELSPLKPYPGFARYMLPMSPLLIILGAALICDLIQRIRPESGTAAAIIVLCAALPPLYQSILINGPKQEDLRSFVPDVVAAVEPRTAFDSYTRFLGSGWAERPCADAASAPYVCDLDRGEHAPTSDNIMVTSNLTYDRYIPFGTAPQQPPETRAAATYYNNLFKLPYLEVATGRPSFGYFNPVIRIIALDGRSERLTPIAAALQRHGPKPILRFSENPETQSELSQPLGATSTRDR